MTEVQETESIISNITNGDHNFKLFRFPGGSYHAGDHAAEQQIYKRTLAINGVYYIDWNSLNGDAEGRTKTAPELLEYLKNNLDTDESTVVLMHDAAAKTATAEGLAAIIEYLMSEGYVFKRLDEMPYLPPTAYNAPSATGSGTYDYGSSYSDDSDYDDDYSDYDDDYDYDDDDDYDSDYGSSYINSSQSSSGKSSSNNNGLSGNGSIISTSPPGTTTRTSVDGTSVTESSGNKKKSGKSSNNN